MEDSFFSSELVEVFEQADADYQQAQPLNLAEPTVIQMEVNTSDSAGLGHGH